MLTHSSLRALSRPVGGTRLALAPPMLLLPTLLLLILTSASSALQAQVQSPRTQQRLMVITQTVTEPAAGLRSTLTARVGSLVFTPQGLTTDRIFETVSNASTITQLAPRDFGTSLTQGQLLAQASVHLSGQAAAIAARLRDELQARGLAQASFMFDQRVNVVGTTQPRQLVWTLTVDRSGQASFASPQLFASQPTILHAHYLPLRVVSGLPQAWAYAGGGSLRWQLLDLQMQPVGPVHQIDTGGAFDPPDELTGAPVDPESGLQCLIDRRARADCPAALTDLMTLIDQNAAASALLDYGQRLSPVYDAITNSAGEVEQVARVSMQVDVREVSYGGCTADMPYRNSGNYGFTLRTVSDRYAVARDGRFSRLNRMESTSLSPTRNYDWTRLLRPMSVAALSPMILDPDDPARPLLRAAEIGNLLFLAPIITRGSEQQTLANFTSPQNDRSRLQVAIECSIDGTWTVRSMIAPWAQCYSGGCNSDYRAYEFSFRPGTASLGPTRPTATSYLGQLWEPQQVEFDGTDTITVWHEARYGCSSMIGAQFSLAGQYLGVVNQVSCPAPGS